MRGAIFRDVTTALVCSFGMETHPAIDAGATRRALVTIATARHARSRMQSDYLKRLIGQPSTAVDFSGLSKLEVRAQCALVRRASERLDLPHASAMLARFGQTHSEREAGVDGLATHLCGRFASPARDSGNRGEAIRMLVVRRYLPQSYRSGYSFRDIGQRTSVPKSTLCRIANRIEREADHLEAEALAELEKKFVPQGVCELSLMFL